MYCRGCAFKFLQVLKLIHFLLFFFKSFYIILISRRFVDSWMAIFKNDITWITVHGITIYCIFQLFPTCSLGSLFWSFAPQNGHRNVINLQILKEKLLSFFQSPHRKIFIFVCFDGKRKWLTKELRQNSAW